MLCDPWAGHPSRTLTLCCFGAAAWSLQVSPPITSSLTRRMPPAPIVCPARRCAWRARQPARAAVLSDLPCKWTLWRSAPCAFSLRWSTGVRLRAANRGPEVERTSRGVFFLPPSSLPSGLACGGHRRRRTPYSCLGTRPARRAPLRCAQPPRGATRTSQGNNCRSRRPLPRRPRQRTPGTSYGCRRSAETPPTAPIGFVSPSSPAPHPSPFRSHSLLPFWCFQRSPPPPAHLSCGGLLEAERQASRLAFASCAVPASSHSPPPSRTDLLSLSAPRRYSLRLERPERAAAGNEDAAEGKCSEGQPAADPPCELEVSMSVARSRDEHPRRRRSTDAFLFVCSKCRGEGAGDDSTTSEEPPLAAQSARANMLR